MVATEAGSCENGCPSCENGCPSLRWKNRGPCGWGAGLARLCSGPSGSARENVTSPERRKAVEASVDGAGTV